MNMVLSVGELSCLSMFVCTLDATLDVADSLLPTAPLLVVFFCRCLLIQDRLNELIDMTLNVRVLRVSRCSIRGALAC